MLFYTSKSAVAYNEAYLRQLSPQSKLEISGAVHYGKWSGRVDGLSYQEILVVQRSEE